MKKNKMHITNKIYTEEELDFTNMPKEVVFITKSDGKITSLTSKIYKKCKQDNITLYYILDKNDSEIKKAGIKTISSKTPANLFELKELVDEGFDGIWLSEESELVFRIKDISHFLHNQNPPISLMVTINSGKNDFFIRPEDLIYYEMFVDLGFLLTPLDRKKIIVEAYQQRHWEGLLTDIIVNKTEDKIITNKGFFRGFGLNRINCGKRCLLDKCKICENAYGANSLISNLGLEIKEDSLGLK